MVGASLAFYAFIGFEDMVNGAPFQIIMASRVCYGLSGQGWLPPFFGQVHPITHTPLKDTVVVTILILTLALWLPIDTLARAASVLIMTVFALIQLALLRIKKHTPAPSRAFLVPRWLPASGFIAISSFIAYQLAAAMLE